MTATPLTDRIVEIPTIDMGNRAISPALVKARAPGRARIAL